MNIINEIISLYSSSNGQLVYNLLNIHGYENTIKAYLAYKQGECPDYLMKLLFDTITDKDSFEECLTSFQKMITKFDQLNNDPRLKVLLNKRVAALPEINPEAEYIQRNITNDDKSHLYRRIYDRSSHSDSLTHRTLCEFGKSCGCFYGNPKHHRTDCRCVLCPVYQKSEDLRFIGDNIEAMMKAHSSRPALARNHRMGNRCVYSGCPYNG